MEKKTIPVPVVTIDNDAIYRPRGVDVDALQAATREEIRRRFAAKQGA